MARPPLSAVEGVGVAGGDLGVGHRPGPVRERAAIRPAARESPPC
jgi:hypothetical protein